MSRWFAEYLEAFAACGRGERATASLLDYYAVPLLVTTDQGFSALPTAEAVVAAVQPQVDEMRSGTYARSELVGAEVTTLNASSALHRGTFSWQRADGSELRRFTATYLITDGPPGRRISVLAVHGS